jgi:hypothetical protein
MWSTSFVWTSQGYYNAPIRAAWGCRSSRLRSRTCLLDRVSRIGLLRFHWCSGPLAEEMALETRGKANTVCQASLPIDEVQVLLKPELIPVLADADSADSRGGLNEAATAAW